MSQNQRSSKGRPYRIGLVGAGNVSRMHLEGMSRHPDKVDIHAVFDLNEQNLAEKSEKYGIKHTFSSFDEFIRRSDVDAVVVCTPSHVRETVLYPLLDAGLPIFCEKPISEDYGTAHAIAEYAARRGVPIAVNQNFRRYFTFSLAKELLDRGALTQPIQLMQTVTGSRRSEGWRSERERFVMSVMSNHWFDGYRYMLGDEPESVYCEGIKSKNGQDRAVSVVLRFGKGTVVSLNESFISWHDTQSALLDCANGGLVLGYKQLEHIGALGERTLHDNPFDKPAATFHLLYDLLESAAEGRRPETAIEDNLKSIRVMEAAYRSLNTNTAVKVEDIV
ncbi:Gfo/Idh/MocA family protein [Cohnella cellulosilytica]|uniref:Gfo/Idh/MocA family protein n=1 Tax=Cohnella cellulosilytica TaxID=986710 RepID=A0ABW2F7U4_9BACL